MLIVSAHFYSIHSYILLFIRYQIVIHVIIYLKSVVLERAVAAVGSGPRTGSDTPTPTPPVVVVPIITGPAQVAFWLTNANKSALFTPKRVVNTNNNLVRGSLKPEFQNAYATYFVKYIQGMATEGIPIDAITRQNEPLHGATTPVC